VSSGQSPWLLNRDVLCFLWGTNWICICYVEESRPPLWSSGQSSWLLNGDVLCFLWGTNWICICYVEESRPPLWSSGQSSWLQNGDVLCFLWGRTEFLYAMYQKVDCLLAIIQRPGFISRCYQIFWEVVGLERGPPSLVSKIEELLEGKNSRSGLENREFGRRDLSIWPRDTLYPQKLALTSPTSCGRSVSIVRSRTHATEFSLVLYRIRAGNLWSTTLEGYHCVSLVGGEIRHLAVRTGRVQKSLCCSQLFCSN
jgi:hypothetical protein